MRITLIFVLVLLLIPMVKAEEISLDKFQNLELKQQEQIKKHIDKKYLEAEEYWNLAIPDVMNGIDLKLDNAVRRFAVVQLSTQLFGVVLVFLFINWYLRRIRRSEWDKLGK